jgi:hypothetical protein
MTMKMVMFLLVIGYWFMIISTYGKTSIFKVDNNIFHIYIFSAQELDPCAENDYTLNCNGGQCLFSQTNNYQTCM